MDLGLEAASAGNGSDGPREPAHKKAAVGEAPKDLIKMVALIAKLSLSTAQCTRCLRSVMLEVFTFVLECSLVQAVKTATRKYREACEKIPDSVQRKARLGLPHIHVWNALLHGWKEYLGKQGSQESQEKLTMLNTYIQKYQGLGWEILSEQVKFARLKKIHDRKRIHLEMNVKPGTDSNDLYEGGLKEWILHHPECDKIVGQAPPGDLERRIQQWLEENGFSEKRDDK